jgi:hypothetical protein
MYNFNINEYKVDKYYTQQEQNSFLNGPSIKNGVSKKRKVDNVFNKTCNFIKHIKGRNVTYAEANGLYDEYMGNDGDIFMAFDSMEFCITMTNDKLALFLNEKKLKSKTGKEWTGSMVQKISSCTKLRN